MGAVPAVCCHQVSFVEACVALDRLKPAARAVRQLKLGAEFPNVEALYRQRSLARLVGKRLWPVALSYAGSEVSLQVCAGRRWWQASSCETVQEGAGIGVGLEVDLHTCAGVRSS